ncbi:ABC transporter ATP-binding protein [Nesterenkonia ebinurensis]|uniref:ABC transporter ATP-binding protein n=1 Tax=Nesterenkonia ebinurensis TaxID=2608252 RepID=UPI00123C7F89|nr:ABC transporter ATP-binding protein [Nesterenkonia ebinurensis]
MTTMLTLENLTVELGPKDARRQVVRGVSLNLQAGRIQGLAGESGSGKTVTAMAVLGLLPASARVTGSARLGEVDLTSLRPRELNRIRGRRVAMVFQDPSASLHPQITIGAQLTDHLRHHLGLKRKAAQRQAMELLARVKVPHPQEALSRFPHQFSGGQRQRIAIAIALACDPEVLLADEPTTALDVTVQAGILHLLRELVDERDLAVLLVTHDLGVMSAVADDVAVMRDGRVVESGTRAQMFTDPQHPYTRQLLEAMPDAQESEVL